MRDAESVKHTYEFLLSSGTENIPVQMRMRFGKRWKSYVSSKRPFKTPERKQFTKFCVLCNESFTTHKLQQAMCDRDASMVSEVHKKSGGRDRTREMVRIRDSHTCQQCGEKWLVGNRRFDVHHLNGLCGKKSRKYDSSKETAGLITYCHACHMSMHANMRKEKYNSLKGRLQEIKSARKNNESFDRIAERMGVSQASVFMKLQRNRD